MNAKGIIEVVVVAACVAVSLIAALYPAGVEAGNGPAAPAENNKPRFVRGGVEMTVALADGAKPVAGQAPVLMLEAVNTTDQPVETSVMLFMAQAAPGSEMSRMVPKPSVIWSQSPSLRLEPKAKTSLRIETGVPLRAGAVTAVHMREPIAVAIGANGRPLNEGQLIKGSILAVDLTVARQPAKASSQPVKTNG